MEDAGGVFHGHRGRRAKWRVARPQSGAGDRGRRNASAIMRPGMSMPRRLLWFVALWAAGVGAVWLLAFLLRAAMRL